MCVVKFFKNMPKKPSLHIHPVRLRVKNIYQTRNLISNWVKAIYRMPIELNRITLDIPTYVLGKAVQSNYVLNKIQILPFC